MPLINTTVITPLRFLPPPDTIRAHNTLLLWAPGLLSIITYHANLSRRYYFLSFTNTTIINIFLLPMLPRHHVIIIYQPHILIYLRHHAATSLFYDYHYCQFCNTVYTPIQVSRFTRFYRWYYSQPGLTLNNNINYLFTSRHRPRRFTTRHIINYYWYLLPLSVMNYFILVSLFHYFALCRHERFIIRRRHYYCSSL